MVRFTMQKEPRRRVGDQLLLHFCGVTLLMVLVVGFKILRMCCYPEGILKYRPWACSLYYLQDTLTSVIPLNVLAISFERRELRLLYHSEFLREKCILAMWAASLTANLPTLCIRADNQDGFEFLFSFHNGLKLVLFSLLPGVCLLCCLCYVKPVIVDYFMYDAEQASESFWRKVYAFRLEFLRSIGFLIVWLPSQVFGTLYSTWILATKPKSEHWKECGPGLYFILQGFVMLYCIVILATHLIFYIKERRKFPVVSFHCGKDKHEPSNLIELQLAAQEDTICDAGKLPSSLKNKVDEKINRQSISKPVAFESENVDKVYSNDRGKHLDVVFENSFVILHG